MWCLQTWPPPPHKVWLSMLTFSQNDSTEFKAPWHNGRPYLPLQRNHICLVWSVLVHIRPIFGFGNKMSKPVKWPLYRDFDQLNVHGIQPNLHTTLLVCLPPQKTCHPFSVSLRLDSPHLSIVEHFVKTHEMTIVSQFSHTKTEQKSKPFGMHMYPVCGLRNTMSNIDFYNLCE